MLRNGGRGRDDSTGKSGRGGGGGQGIGMGRGGRGGGAGLGPGGVCVCPDCGTTIQHQPGLPCAQMKCAKCGASMVRQR